jgi:hypothetical protein
MRGDGTVSGAIGNGPFQGTKEEDWVRVETEKEREREGQPFFGLKGR